MKIVNEKDKIDKFLEKLNIKFYLTPIQVRNLVIYMYFYFEISFNGKIKNITNVYFCNTHRSSINRFLTSSPWDEEKILSVLKKDVIKSIQNISMETGQPIQLIIDDTITEKTKPSSKALNTTEGTQYHFSHTKGKSVFGHQIVVGILKCGKTKIPIEIVLYNKKIETKIDIAKRIIEDISELIKIDYLLTDSWYACVEIIKLARKKDIIYLGALRGNRVIYPYRKKAKGIQISEFVLKIKKKDFNLVTVRGKKYYTYRYTGKINRLKDVCIIITYPYKYFGDEKKLKAFITTNTEFMTTEILHKYMDRWPVEVFIRECKGKLGLNNYQVYSLRGIRRNYIIIMLTYYYIISRNKKLSFSKNHNNIKKKVFQNLINFVYSAGKENLDLEEVLKSLNVA
jgi:hypothetical protein